MKGLTSLEESPLCDSFSAWMSIFILDGLGNIRIDSGYGRLYVLGRFGRLLGMRQQKMERKLGGLHRKETRMVFRKLRGISTSVAIAFGLTQMGLPGVMGQDKVTPSSQGAVSSAGQGGTVMMPQDQVVYETVYDTHYVQVPTTQMQTQCKTEYRTQTVPVTRVVTEQVPTTQMQTQYKTEYQTRTIPVTRMVAEQVPTTQMQTLYKIEYKTQTVPVTKTVAEVVNVPRSYTVYVPKTQTVNQLIYKTILVPTTQTQKQQRCITVMKTVAQTQYQPQTTTVMTSPCKPRM